MWLIMESCQKAGSVLGKKRHPQSKLKTKIAEKEGKKGLIEADSGKDLGGTEVHDQSWDFSPPIT